LNEKLSGAVTFAAKVRCWEQLVADVSAVSGVSRTAEEFVVHVLQRLRKAAIISIDSPGVFRVCKGADRGNKNLLANDAYHVCFGNDSSLPSCECEDWMRHYRPCKHVCAIFRHFPEHS